MHKESSPLAGTKVTIKGEGKFNGAEYQVEDWWDKIAGKSWMVCDGNPACLAYAVRSAVNDLPSDNEVLYGKVKGLGYLVHISEIEE